MTPERGPTAPPPDEHAPRPLTAAVQGFVELATWWTSLAGGNAATVARAVDEDRLDGTTAATALARGAALPLLGWVGLVNEVFDAAAVIRDPPERRRRRESEVFVVDVAWAGRDLRATGPPFGFLPGEGPGVPEPPGGPPLANGRGERLVGEVKVVAVDAATVPAGPRPSAGLPIRLVAERIPPECVGVYAGTVAPVDQRNDDGAPVPVWITVP